MDYYYISLKDTIKIIVQTWDETHQNLDKNKIRKEIHQKYNTAIKLFKFGFELFTNHLNLVFLFI